MTTMLSNHPKRKNLILKPISILFIANNVISSYSFEAKRKENESNLQSYT